MTEKDKDFLEGLAISAACHVLPARKVFREPIAYSYNGVILPKLPEWDREAYPYAVIYNRFMGINILHVSSSKWIGTGEPFFAYDEPFGEKTVNESPCLRFEIKYEYEGNRVIEYWGDTDADLLTQLGQMVDTDGDGFVDRGAESAYWSNHDIIGADGTVLIAASDPIPIYE